MKSRYTYTSRAITFLAAAAVVFTLLVGLFPSFAVPEVSAATVKLAWDANTEPDLAGYKIHWGETSGNYTSHADAGLATTFVVTDLADGKIYYFAATAYDTKGNESGYSNEVIKEPAALEVVSAPNIPSGAASGIVAESHTYTVAGASSNYGDPIQYRFLWGDGEFSEWLPPGISALSKSWLSAGTYSVRAGARCGLHPSIVSPASPELMVTLSGAAQEKISTPNTPAGQTVGNTNVSYSYNSGGADSSKSDPVQYLFGWGDGTISGWLTAGLTGSAKAWLSPGTYLVGADARCEIHNTVTSTPSVRLAVNMSSAPIESVSRPITPSGKYVVLAGMISGYASGGAKSSFGDPVQYRFSWGDGTVSDWISNGNGNVTARKSWAVPGSYLLAVEARCAFHTSVVSKPSNPVSVVVRSGTSLIFGDDFADGGPVGDPDWKIISGKWTVGRRRSLIASALTVNRAHVATLLDFIAGRLESRIKLTGRFAKRPNAGIIFAFWDKAHYRYVLLTTTKAMIGQAGEYGGERAGKKASAPVSVAVKRWSRLTVDIHDDGRVSVFINDAAAPILTHKFAAALSGSVGCLTYRANAQFDDFAVRDETALP